MLDERDIAILRQLQANARISNAELARRVHLSPPATHARVRRLEETGCIRRYAAQVDRRMAGFDMLCFVHVSLQLHQADPVAGFRDAVRTMPRVLECHHVTGDCDYLLKVAITDIREYEDFILMKLTKIPAINKIQTSFILSTVKYETKLPVE